MGVQGEMMSKCPCEECVLLAICIYKLRIKCSMLSDMFKDLDEEDNESQRKIWDEIHKSLPQLGVIGVEP